MINFYRQYEPDIERSTVEWRIHQLVKRNVLERIGRGVYTLRHRLDYQPQLYSDLVRLHEKLLKEFPFLSFCIWSTKWLNEFTVHQPGRFFTFIETEQDGIEPVFYSLKGVYEQVYVSPSAEVIEKYISGHRESLIITKLVTEAPLQKADGVSVPTLEKILVDLFCNELLFGAFQGRELKNIYTNAVEKYAVDESRLFRYASRRGKKEELRTYIEEINLKFLTNPADD